MTQPDKWDDEAYHVCDKIGIRGEDCNENPLFHIANALRSAYAEGEREGLEKAIQAIAMGRRKWGLGGILYAHIINATRAAKETKP